MVSAMVAVLMRTSRGPFPAAGTRPYQTNGTPLYQYHASGTTLTIVDTAHEVLDTQSGTVPWDFRQRLLDGMAAAIRECGYRDSTVAGIVRHARTSRRTFYEHFTSKQDCFIALLREANTELTRQIAAAVDPHAPWEAQVRQAIGAWIDGSQCDPSITLSWIRELPSLGEEARHLQRESAEAFVVLIQTLASTPGLRAAGVPTPSRQLTIMLIGGLRELLAATVEDGGDIAAITEVAVRATQALLRVQVSFELRVTSGLTGSACTISPLCFWSSGWSSAPSPPASAVTSADRSAAAPRPAPTR
jgi:AcrR family transcriptional regulator